MPNLPGRGRSGSPIIPTNRNPGNLERSGVFVMDKKSNFNRRRSKPYAEGLGALFVVIPLGALWCVGGVVFALSLFMGWDKRLGLLGGAAGALVAFLWLVSRVAREYFPEPEPKEPKEPKRYDQAVKVAIIDRSEDEYPKCEYAHLSIDAKRLRQFASGVLGGRPISEASWTGSQGLFSRGEFGQLRSELLERGLVRWVNERSHSQGLEISKGGLSLLRHVSKEPDPMDLSPALPSKRSLLAL